MTEHKVNKLSESTLPANPDTLKAVEKLLRDGQAKEAASVAKGSNLNEADRLQLKDRLENAVQELLGARHLGSALSIMSTFYFTKAQIKRLKPSALSNINYFLEDGNVGIASKAAIAFNLTQEEREPFLKEVSRQSAGLITEGNLELAKLALESFKVPDRERRYYVINGIKKLLQEQSADVVSQAVTYFSLTQEQLSSAKHVAIRQAKEKLYTGEVQEFIRLNEIFGFTREDINFAKYGLKKLLENGHITGAAMLVSDLKMSNLEAISFRPQILDTVSLLLAEGRMDLALNVGKTLGITREELKALEKNIPHLDVTKKQEKEYAMAAIMLVRKQISEGRLQEAQENVHLLGISNADLRSLVPKAIRYLLLRRDPSKASEAASMFGITESNLMKMAYDSVETLLVEGNIEKASENALFFKVPDSDMKKIASESTKLLLLEGNPKKAAEIASTFEVTAPTFRTHLVYAVKHLLAEDRVYDATNIVSTLRLSKEDTLEFRPEIISALTRLICDGFVYDALSDAPKLFVDSRELKELAMDVALREAERMFLVNSENIMLAFNITDKYIELVKARRSD